jgi:hypothetical protein
MNASDATRIAQSDPVSNLTTNYGTHVLAAKRHLANLVKELRDLDHCRMKALEHGVTLDVDLGPIGNAAASVRRDLEKQKDAPTFALPKLTTEEAAKLPPIR